MPFTLLLFAELELDWNHIFPILFWPNVSPNWEGRATSGSGLPSEQSARSNRTTEKVHYFLLPSDQLRCGHSLAVSSDISAYKIQSMFMSLRVVDEGTRPRSLHLETIIFTGLSSREQARSRTPTRDSVGVHVSPVIYRIRRSIMTDSCSLHSCGQLLVCDNTLGSGNSASFLTACPSHHCVSVDATKLVWLQVSQAVYPQCLRLQANVRLCLCA